MKLEENQFWAVLVYTDTGSLTFVSPRHNKTLLMENYRKEG